MKRNLLILLAALAAATTTSADVVRTTDGATLTGTITLIDKGVIHLKTAYAGTLKIQQELVESFESEEPRVLRLASGTIMAGPVEGGADGKIRIESEDGVLETNTAKVAAAWNPGDEDPEVVRNRRSWRYDASFDLTGKDGNTDKYRIGTSLVAELKSPNDTLRFFFEYENAEEENEKTEDRVKGGTSYESFFSKKLGWYVRTDLERDKINEIGLRSTSGAGMSYRLINKDNQTLVARTGLGYRYTSYDDDTDDESSATLDLGLSHTYRFNDHLFMRNNLGYAPALDDFGNYTAFHDTGIEIPVGSGENWKIRMGVRNEYDSEPSESTDEKLDTSYYTKMVYSWF